MLNLCLTFKEVTVLLPEVAVPFYILISIYEVPVSPRSCQHLIFCLSSYYYYSHSGVYKVRSHCGFNLTND